MNKYFLSFVASIVLVFTLVSCSTNSPKSVANKFLTDFYQMKYDDAKKVSTDDTKKMLEMFQQLETMIPDSAKQKMKNTKITIKDVKEEGDKATATYITSDNPKEQTIHLLKQKNQWLVQWSKQDQMNDAGGAADQQPADQQPAAGAADTTSAPPSSATSAPAADTTKTK